MGDLVAVMGMEMTEGAFVQLITDNVSSFNTQCLAQNHHLVLKAKESISRLVAITDYREVIDFCINAPKFE